MTNTDEPSASASASLMRRVSSLPDLQVEEVLDVMNAVDRFQAEAKRVKAALEESLKAWIDEHGEIEHGDKRWYVGKETSYKPLLTPADLVSRLMEASGGDFQAFVGLLSSDAFKPGACKKVLGHDFGAVFETVVKPDLKTGEPRRRVVMVDKRFVDGRRQGSATRISSDDE